MIAARWRCSTTTITATMTRSRTRTVPRRNCICRDMNRGRGRSGLTSGSPVVVEPDLLERDVGVPQAVHCHASDVRLKEPLVGVVPDRNDRSVVQNEPLGLSVEIHLSGQVALAPCPGEKLVEHPVGVPSDVSRAPRIEEVEEETV